MTNGLGAGFFALTLLGVLAGLAAVVVVGTLAAVVYHRRTGQFSTQLGYLFVVLCAGELVVTGFGILVLSDSVPGVAWLLTTLVILPFVGGSSYAAYTTELSRVEAITSTVMTWGGSFFVGLGIAVGVLFGINSVFTLAPAESQQMGVPWLAATTGGLAVLLSMHLIGTYLTRRLFP